MKKYIFLSLLAACGITASAQDFDTKPTVQFSNSSEKVKFTIGGRFMADAAYYNVDEPYSAVMEGANMKSGGSIVDARIRTSMQYGDNWYFYADFGFGGGKFAQKNIFLQYSTEDAAGGNHAIKAGYYNDPASSMSKQTSLASYHFISRAGSANALGRGRSLGVTYKYENDHVFAYQGAFFENQYNKVKAGYNGGTAAGRWLYRPISGEEENLHVGVSASITHLSGGEQYTSKGASVLKKDFYLGQSMETYVDETEQFVGGTRDWADNVANIGAEALYHNGKFFARGEYFHKIITKKRDSYKLFISQQDNIDGWGDFDAWVNANPLATNNFDGAYVELGGILWGKANYKYDRKNATLSGLSDKALEIVGRVNFTNLNNVKDGDYYSAMRDQYYAAGFLEDWPGTGSTSFGGGKVISATVGLNYSFNRFAQVMLDYTYSNLDRDRYKRAKNFQTGQARVQFVF